MNGRNATRFARLRQARHVDHAPTGQADAARSAALANRARQRGCTSPGPQDSRRVARADRVSTRRLLPRQRFANLATRSRIASGARRQSGTHVRARGDRACGRWLRFWRRTRGQYISGEKQKRPRSAASFGWIRIRLPSARDSDGESAQQVLIERRTGLDHVADSAGRAPVGPASAPLESAVLAVACTN